MSRLSHDTYYRIRHRRFMWVSEAVLLAGVQKDANIADVYTFSVRTRGHHGTGQAGE
jgi:hypothetical protein